MTNADWSPYSDGYWAYTDDGWTWISNEEFGWAVYHYGRWIRAYDEWLWIPGTEWAPAWVSWRMNDDYVGWAPLPPEAVWEPEVTFTSWVDSYYDIGPSWYVFIPYNRFSSPSMRPYIVNRGINISILHNTINITNIHRHSGRVGRVFAGGPDIDRMDRLVQGRVRRLELRRDDEDFRRDWMRPGERGRPGAPGVFSRIRDNQLIVAAPAIQRGSETSRPTRVAQRLGRDGVDRGWRGLSNTKLVEEVREKQRAEFTKSSPKSLPERKPRIITATMAPSADGPNAPKRIQDGPPGANNPPGSGRGDRDRETVLRPTMPDGSRPVRPGADTPAVPRPGRPSTDGRPSMDGRPITDGRVPSQVRPPGEPVTRPGMPVLPRDRERAQRPLMPDSRGDDRAPRTNVPEVVRPDGRPSETRPERPVMPGGRPQLNPEGRPQLRPQQPEDRPRLPQIRPEMRPEGGQGQPDYDRGRRGGGPPTVRPQPQARPESSTPPQARPSVPQVRPQMPQPQVQRPQVQRPQMPQPQVQRPQMPQPQARPQPTERPQFRPQPQAAPRPQAPQFQPPQGRGGPPGGAGREGRGGGGGPGRRDRD